MDKIITELNERLSLLEIADLLTISQWCLHEKLMNKTFTNEEIDILKQKHKEIL